LGGSLLFNATGHAQELNWIQNGDFSSPAHWLGNFSPKPGPQGGTAAYLENSQHEWNSVEQSVALPQPAPPALEISGWMKCANIVQGTKDWEKARITVVFFDPQGTQVGGWPADIARVLGTKDWAAYANQYAVPSGQLPPRSPSCWTIARARAGSPA
jgi:hypothetical protein